MWASVVELGGGGGPAAGVGPVRRCRLASEAPAVPGSLQESGGNLVSKRLMPGTQITKGHHHEQTSLWSSDPGRSANVGWPAPGLSKRGNALRVMVEAVRWGKRGARVNTISPGIIITPMAKDELIGPGGEGYRRMIELCPAGRGGTPDEVRTVGALLMGPDGGFITGSDFLMDGGLIAAYRSGELAP
jgi:NAD(P)-dependent dehydrogenase (short-subunit alcohol dehydrogenase family)